MMTSGQAASEVNRDTRGRVKMRTVRLFGALILNIPCFMLVCTPAAAQPAMPTVNLLGRVLMVKSPAVAATGTIFSIDVDHREYWITAKHVLTGAEHPPYGFIEAKDITLSILNPEADSSTPGMKWLSEKFYVIDPGKDIDIVVLAAEQPLELTPSDISVAPGFMLGGDCEFLGFPFSAPWRITFQGKQFWMPFIKHCTISAETDDKMMFLARFMHERKYRAKTWMLLFAF